MDVNKRTPIPAEMRRRVLIEAGHRCAIHTCKHETVEIHHIEPWSKCQSHDFQNLIALCPNCHERADRNEIDKKTLRLYKARLAALLEKGVAPQFVSCQEYPTGSRHADAHSIGFVSRTLNSTSVNPNVYEFNIEYPVISHPDKAVETEVNTLIAGFVCNEKFHAYDLLQIINEAAGKDESVPFLPYSLDISFDLTTFQKSILSIKFAIRSFTGGAYSNGRFHTFNFVLTNPPFLIAPYMIGIGNLLPCEELSELCAKHLEEQLEIDPEHLQFENDLRLFEHFNLLEHGLALSFDEHTLAGKWLGATSIVIPYSKVAAVREKLRELRIYP